MTVNDSRRKQTEHRRDFLRSHVEGTDELAEVVDPGPLVWRFAVGCEALSCIRDKGQVVENTIQPRYEL